MEQEHDPLSNRHLNNAYDPLFAQRIASLGGSQPVSRAPAPRPQQSGGAGGGALAAIIAITLIGRVFLSSTRETYTPPPRPAVDFKQPAVDFRQFDADMHRLQEQQRMIDDLLQRNRDVAGLPGNRQPAPGAPRRERPGAELPGLPKP
jgi:hypothetical protein